MTLHWRCLVGGGMATNQSTSDVLTLANAVTSAGVGAAGSWANAGHIQAYQNWTVQVSGTGTGLSIKLNGGLDGVTWTDSGHAAVTANGLYQFSFPSAVPYVQANIAAITGGSVTVLAVGVN